ncbi:MAG: DUF5989 family protein [Planctomycetota bacterium]
MSEQDTELQNESSRFEQAAAEPDPGLLREFWEFLRHNKKWWMAPLLLALLVLGAMVLLSQSAVAPFIYPLF